MEKSITQQLDTFKLKDNTPLNLDIPADIVEAANKVHIYMHRNKLVSLMGLSFRELTDLDHRELV